MIPQDAKYTKTHEYARPEADGVVTVGITAFAAEQLGDIVYLELPEAHAAVTKDQPFGVIESVKAAADINSPVSGEVVEANEPVTEEFDTISGDPFGEGWFIKVRPSDPGELDALMSAEEYTAFLATQDEAQ